VTRRTLDDGCELDDDAARVDAAAVHRFLSEQAYWCLGRPRSVNDELIAGATRIVGLYAPTGDQVGFARAVSDRHTFAYLADVYVLDHHRGRGLGVELVREMIDGSAYAHVRWMLGTLDAHALYAKLGFGEPTERIMERRRRDPVTGELQEMGQDG
jgi:GNAT superfamily N-acetyltransferase